MAKRISFTRPRFDFELAVSDSWPPLFYLESKNGVRHYLPLSVTTFFVDGFARFEFIVGPFYLSLTVFTGEL